MMKVFRNVSLELFSAGVKSWLLEYIENSSQKKIFPFVTPKTESFSQLLKAISSESFQSQLVRDHFFKEFSKIFVLRASTVKTMRS